MSKAFALAAVCHRDQERKGTGAPYLTHLLGVTELVWLAGGTDVEAAGALLHDSVEDGGGYSMLAEIRDRLGERGDVVATIVLACSDSLVDTRDGGVKPPWRERKRQYIEHLATSDNQSALLVSACDKLHNLRAIRTDYDVLGEELWRRFNPDGGWRGAVWYYTALLDIYRQRGDSRVRGLAERIGLELAGLRALLAGRGHDPSDLEPPFNRAG